MFSCDLLASLYSLNLATYSNPQAFSFRVLMLCNTMKTVLQFGTLAVYNRKTPTTIKFHPQQYSRFCAALHVHHHKTSILHSHALQRRVQHRVGAFPVSLSSSRGRVPAPVCVCVLVCTLQCVHIVNITTLTTGSTTTTRWHQRCIARSAVDEHCCSGHVPDYAHAQQHTAACPHSSSTHCSQAAHRCEQQQQQQQQ